LTTAPVEQTVLVMLLGQVMLNGGGGDTVTVKLQQLV
jgi:hypothetical protein